MTPSTNPPKESYFGLVRVMPPFKPGQPLAPADERNNKQVLLPRFRLVNRPFLGSVPVVRTERETRPIVNADGDPIEVGGERAFVEVDSVTVSYPAKAVDAKGKVKSGDTPIVEATVWPEVRSAFESNARPDAWFLCSGTLSFGTTKDGKPYASLSVLDLVPVTEKLAAAASAQEAPVEAPAVDPVPW